MSYDELPRLASLKAFVFDKSYTKTVQWFSFLIMYQQVHIHTLIDNVYW